MLLWVVVDRWGFFFLDLCGLLLDVLGPCGSLPIAVVRSLFQQVRQNEFRKKTIGIGT